MLWVAARCLFMLPALAFAAGCSNPTERPGPIDGVTVSVRGRVVDAESCASTAGCLGVQGMVVRVWGGPDSLVSEPTGLDGAFEIEGLQPGRHEHLVARPEAAATDFAPTLNPMVLPPEQTEDLFGVELSVLSRAPNSLLEALRAEGIDLVLGGGYVGQAVHELGTSVEAAPGVRVHVHPEPASLRFVAALPRYVPDEPVLRPSTAETTGPFGIFIAEADRPRDLVAVAAIEEGVDFDLVITPIEPGMVTYAIHRGR